MAFTFTFYEYNFAFLLIVIAGLSYRQYKLDATVQAEKALESTSTNDATLLVARRKFTRIYLSVYALVMAGDWLQGAHIYALYKEQYGFPEETVALFFTAGFVSGAISAYFVGALADKLGRRFMCCVFCLTYSLSCLSTLFPIALYLFVGRLLGGVATSILYSAFEAWMVTEHNKRGLGDTSRLFGLVTGTNSLVAIASGVVSEWLVSMTGTRTAPFMASIVCLTLATVLMLTTWSENYGGDGTGITHQESEDTKSAGIQLEVQNHIKSITEEETPVPVPAKSANALAIIFKSPNILSLGLTSCIFEGSMYLFVFFWSPALKSTLSSPTASLPYGLIFANFMASMMLGSLLFAHVHILAVLLQASATFVVNILVKNEAIVFWAFCLFEACVGMYFPLIGGLKGRFVDDGVRGAVYATLRIPLNVFVVITLAMTKEGDGHRNLVFMMCSGLLVVSAGVLSRYVR